MRRISSHSTFWYKRGFPLLWFGILSVVGCAVLAGVLFQGTSVFVLAVPILMGVFGYILLRTLVFILLDAVYLDDDVVVVQNGGQEDRFPISNILNVDCTSIVNPEQIKLSLREPCLFGKEIVFSPPGRFWKFSRHPVATELIQRANSIGTSGRHW